MTLVYGPSPASETPRGHSSPVQGPFAPCWGRNCQESSGCREADWSPLTWGWYRKKLFCPSERAHRYIWAVLWVLLVDFSSPGVAAKGKLSWLPESQSKLQPSALQVARKEKYIMLLTHSRRDWQWKRDLSACPVTLNLKKKDCSVQPSEKSSAFSQNIFSWLG